MTSEAEEPLRQSPSSDPDLGFAAENHPVINARYYAGSPDDYLMRRLTLLALLMDRGDDINGLMREGAEIGGLRLQLETDPTNQEAAAEDRRKRSEFVSTEALALLHHASETLLRLYLAHAPADDPCPPLTIAREWRPGAFKQAVAARFKDRAPTDADLDANGRVFYGTEDGSSLLDVSDGDFRAACENAEKFLRAFARIFLDAAPYNAVKHGFTIQAGQSRLTVEVDGRQIGASEGPHVEVLERRQSEDGDRRWALATRWLDIDLMAKQIVVAHRMIDALWRTAREKYTRERAGSRPRLDQPRFDDLERDSKIEIPYIAEGLRYHEADHDAGSETPS